MAIDSIASKLGTHAPAIGAKASGAPDASGSVDFGAALKNILGSVDSSTSDANQAVGNMLDGSGDVHEAMIALQRADMMFQLTVQIRNKVVQAYQDVMRMPV
jgi:flagellar hook-basal body complex protein FliE